MNYTTRATCRVCGGDELTPLFDLGDQYVSDFVPEDKIYDGHRCPIELELCEHCTLVQMKHTAPQDFLYTRHYWYRSGVTDTMRAALKDVVDAATRLVELKSGDVVLDIGSNDGTLLRYYQSNLVKVGVEPATNLVEVGKQGVDVFINDFWSAEKYFERLTSMRNKWLTCAADGRLINSDCAKVITACGMFYDLEDPNQFIADIAKALHPDGVFIAQLMCLKNMISLGDIGNLAHEHLEFYSLKSLQFLLGKYGLEIYDIETNKVNGESYRLFIRHRSNRPFKPVSPHIENALEWEEQLNNPLFFDNFYKKMKANRDVCIRFIQDEAAIGKKIWVYGASTKGNVILQWYNLSRPLIYGAADRSPEKWGKYTVGTGLKIVSEEEARSAMPDYFLVLPYAFLDEFIERERFQPWRKNGGKFIVPLPEFKLV